MNFTVANENDSTLVKLSGRIDESSETAFMELHHQMSEPKVTIDCGAVQSINSIGIAAWLSCFSSFSGQQLSFVHCPQVLLDSALVLKKFFGNGRIESFFIDRKCSQCGKSSRLEITAQTELHDSHPCPACQAQIESDDDLEDYFDIMNWSNKS